MARNSRGTEAPMDFEWTSRRAIKPSWTLSSDELSTPRKRPHDDLTSTTPFGTPHAPIFGSNQNVPFIFNQNETPRTPHQPPWSPPPLFSPEKAFPNVAEPNDIDMSEVSPSKGDEPKPVTSRTMASGALRRVFKSRQKSRDIRATRRYKKGEEYNDEEDVFESEGEDATLVAQNTSNHYTLNMPAPPAPTSDLPYVLLGYLQFLFNLSLILLFLYLVIQFILTVQRDVEQRISEYSMDIVQEIAICALQYKTNLCATNSIPAMTQQCSNWETCMNRDPAIVGRAKVGAELIAEVVNGFIEPISWKALAFTLTSLSFLTLFINSLLSLFRAKQHPITTPPAHQHPFPSGTPYPPQFGYLSPAPTPSWGRSRSRIAEDFETPTRRRRLEGGDAAKIQ